MSEACRRVGANLLATFLLPSCRTRAKLPLPLQNVVRDPGCTSGPLALTHGATPLPGEGHFPMEAIGFPTVQFHNYQM